MKKTLLIPTMAAWLLACSLGALAAPVQPDAPAACDAGLGMQAAAALGRAHAERLRVTCKTMPSTPDKSIVALSYLNGPGSDDAGGMGDYDVDVLIVQSASGKLLHRLHLDKAVSSDAIRFTSLGIDTANYRLTPGLRAFGLTIGYEGSSRADPFSMTEMRLFVEHHGMLRQILDKVVVKQSSGDWETRCTDHYTEEYQTIAIGPSTAHGFADLVVTKRSTVIDSMAQAGDCHEEKSAPTVTRTTLHFDGDKYVAEGFSYDACNAAFTRGDYATGKRLLQIGIAANDPWAQYLMAFNYDNGRGVKKNHAEALTWHLQAAGGGNWQSSYDLGAAYEEGTVVKRSVDEAVKWYRQAIQQGYPGSDPQAAVERLTSPRKGR